MEAGVGTPLTETIVAGALTGKGSAFLSSDDKQPSEFKTLSAINSRYPSDTIELSSEAQARLQNDRQVLGKLQQGRGELARQETAFIQGQLRQAREELTFLRDLMAFATPEQKEVLAGSVENVGSRLQHIGRQLEIAELTGNHLETAEIIRELEGTAAGFQELVKKLQEHFHDEERIPPRIYAQIREFLERALETDNAAHVDQLA